MSELDEAGIRRALEVYGDTVWGSLSTLRAANRVSDNPTSIEGTFVQCLLAASYDRRMNAGANGLALKAAQSVIFLFAPKLERLAERANIRVFWQDTERKIAACEIEETLLKSESVQIMTRRALAEDRLQTFHDPEFTNEDPNIHIASYAMIANDPDASLIEQYPEFANGCEPVGTTIRRTLDYIEYVKHLPCYRRLFTLKRHLTSMDRVGQLVLGSDF